MQGLRGEYCINKGTVEPMDTCRRNFTPGASYFFTVTLRDRTSSLLVDYVDDLREATRSIKDERPFDIDAIVVMPEHLHAIWTLPPNDADYSIRWREIKTRFARRIPYYQYEGGVWQARFWEHTLRDQSEMENHIDYIHYNPVKHGYVDNVVDWPYSSFHRHVRQGKCTFDWAGSAECEAESLGE